ncbi:uncharacterized protein LOC128880852 [Hylaeus volcanicus]|uniref:uncharacterized protein LOC128880852 n=1 Tax=Hylaeus volcanicus TaxID=313075 RepID=UPI0023B848CF|nr:uncharacterized protein LOC128880852 [Hylaeus volcanicus]
MNGAEATFWWICFAIAFVRFARAEEKKDSEGLNETLQFNICRGVTVCVANDETSIVIRMSTLFKGNEVEQTRNNGRLKLKKGTLKKIGMALMMVPVMMQLMSLPATLASIKFSLLRSIVVGKLALLMVLFNIFKNSQRQEVVVVHKPEYHDHYYNSYHQPEDDDEGWLGGMLLRSHEQ